MVEAALWGLALAIVTSIGAWLEWHSRRTHDNHFAKIVLLESGQDKHATALLNLQQQIDGALAQSAHACQEVAQLKGAFVQDAIEQMQQGKRKR